MLNRLIPAFALSLAALPFGPASAKDSLRDVFMRVNPSVVVIHTVERSPTPTARAGEVALPSLGSGVLISSDGLIMTASHVVHTADQVEVEFITEDRYTAEIVSSDPLTDLALLKIDRIPDGIRPAKLADSDKQSIGDEVLVIGTPYGISHSLSVGHISGRHRSELAPSGSMSMGLTAELFQTDAAINKGNSGGPMFNMSGDVIGIVSYILSQSGGFEGVGFAVASNTARVVLLERQVIWSGVSGIVIGGPLAKALNIPEPAGYLVQKVARGSPAERVGLRPSRVPVVIEGRPLFIGGDIILSIGPVKIGSANARQDIQELIRTMNVGDKISLVVLRDGRREEINYFRVD